MSSPMDLVPLNHTSDIEIARPPELVLEEASKAAAALTRVIDAKPKKVVMNGETYLEFEDWQTVGRFYGMTAKVDWTRPVSFGDVRGFEARAVVLHVPTGREVSAAESMCLNDEDKWSARPKYEWHYVLQSGGTSLEDPGRDEIIWEQPRKKGDKSRPKKQRVLIGDEPVPLFQLRSMAQTRACAKALRNALAWVVVLAGYKATPAEELPASAVEQQDNEPLKVDKTTGEVYDDERPAKPEGSINSKQVSDFWKHAKAHKWPQPTVLGFLNEQGIPGVDHIPQDKLEQLMAVMAAGAPEPDPEKGGVF